MNLPLMKQTESMKTTMQIFWLTTCYTFDTLMHADKKSNLKQKTPASLLAF